MREIGYRAAFITGDDIEEVRDARSEAIDAQLRIKEQDSNVCRGHQILDVAVGARDALELGFQFAVDGLQLLVDGLQLLLASLQLFGSGTIFLIDRLQFFVGRPQLLVRPFIFLS
jgi:hypothetical protein